MSIATADNFKPTNPKPLNEWERYNNGDGTYRDWENNTEIVNFFAGDNMSSTWMKNKYFWIAGTLYQYTGTQFRPTGITGNFYGNARPNDTPQSGATPASQFIYFAGPGTYANFPGADSNPIVLTENLNLISWDGTKASVQEVPVDVDTSEFTLNGGSEKSTQQIDDEKLDKSLFEQYEPHINLDLSTEIYDRPDLPYFQVVIDKENRIINTLSEQEVIPPDLNANQDFDRPDISATIADENNKAFAFIPSGEAGDFYNKPVVTEKYKEYDRPDLGNKVLYVDKHGRLFESDPTIDTDQVRQIANTEAQNVIKENAGIFVRPDALEAFPANADLPPVEYIGQQWDDIIAQYQYRNITKTVVGKSTLLDLDIFKVVYTPENPTIHLFWTTGVHGSEKLHALLFPQIFEFFLDQWTNYPSIKWFLDNVKVTILPCCSPWGYQQFGRRVEETERFPVAWERSGTTMTITINPETFPTSNPLVQAQGYVAGPGCAGKTWVHLWNSDDKTALPDNGYLIQTAIGDYQYTVACPDAGANSGTCMMVISTDPNRNFDTPEGVWADFTPSTTELINYPANPTPCPNNNKGTKPYSLNESLIYKQTIDANPDFIFILDGHDGSGKYNTFMRNEVNETPILDTYAHVQPFASAPYVHKITIPGEPSTGTYSLSKGIQSISHEWRSIPFSGMKAWEVKEAAQWAMNLMLFVTNYYKQN